MVWLVQRCPRKANLLNEWPRPSYSTITMVAAPLPLSTSPARTRTPGANVEDHPPSRQWRRRRRRLNQGFIHRYTVPVRSSQEVQPDSQGQLGCLTRRACRERKASTHLHVNTHKHNCIFVLLTTRVVTSPNTGSFPCYGCKHLNMWTIHESSKGLTWIESILNRN